MKWQGAATSPERKMCWLVWNNQLIGKGVVKMKDSKQLAAFVRAAQGGDQTAFGKLYRATRDRAYFVALTITKNEDDALDILQEAYLKAWQNLSSLENPEQFNAWFRAITGNTAKNYLRKQSPLLFAPMNEDDGGGPLDWLEEKDDEYLPGRSMDTAETRKLIMGIVEKLPEDQRLCVLMHYYEDLPIAEIAVALELPLGTIKSRLWYARQSIGDGVRRLERTNGIKFYSFAPMPLVIWVLRHLKAPAVRHLPRAILGGGATAGGAAVAGGAAAGGTVAGTAASGSGILAAITLPKIIAAVAVLGIAASGAAVLQQPIGVVEAAAVAQTTDDVTAAPFEFTYQEAAHAAQSNAAVMNESVSRQSAHADFFSSVESSYSRATMAAISAATVTDGGVPAATTGSATLANTLRPFPSSAYSHTTVATTTAAATRTSTMTAITTAAPAMVTVWPSTITTASTSTTVKPTTTTSVPTTTTTRPTTTTTTVTPTMPPPPPFKTAPMVSGGHEHSLALKSDGTVWAWGFNGSGELGDGTNTNRLSSVQAQGLTNITAVAAGAYHSIALRNDGTVWTWGRNSVGQLGDGTTTDRNTPMQVQGLSDVAVIARGHNHSLALKSNGTLWAWGSNYAGQLGDGTTTNRTAPVQVLSGVSAIADGWDHVIVLKNDGTVWAWGLNNRGQLGDGTTTNRTTPAQVQGLSDVTAIAPGLAHTMVMKSDGTIWAWGANNYGQLGNGTTAQSLTPARMDSISGVTAIASGHHHSLALKSDGTVWAWGRNIYGAVGDGTVLDCYIPAQAQDLTGVTAISAGSGYSLAMRSNGTVWGWGINHIAGQLGDGTCSDRHAPVQVLGPGGQGFLALK